MKNIVAVLFVLASTFLQAQAFAPDNELDTVPGGIFPTVLENEAYKEAIRLPVSTGTNTGISSRSPLTVMFWTALPAGWEVLIFNEEDRKTHAYHKTFSGEFVEFQEEQKIALLERLKYHSP